MRGAEHQHTPAPARLVQTSGTALSAPIGERGENKMAGFRTLLRSKIGEGSAQNRGSTKVVVEMGQCPTCGQELLPEAQAVRVTELQRVIDKMMKEKDVFVQRNLNIRNRLDQAGKAKRVQEQWMTIRDSNKGLQGEIEECEASYTARRIEVVEYERVLREKMRQKENFEAGE